MRKSPIKELLTVGSAALGLTLIVAIVANFPALVNSDSSYAASCGNNTYLLANFTDYEFTAGTMRENEVIYNTDTRFTFFSMPSQLRNVEYVKTENLGLKDSTNNNFWAVYVCKPSTVYLLYRRISGQTAPNWITSSYQKQSSNTVNINDLSSFVVRKNKAEAMGLYDVYARTLSTPDIVKFEGASTPQSQAHSMYIVAIKPTFGGSTPLPTASPIVTSTPRTNPTNTPRTTSTPRASATNTARASATSTPRTTPTPTPVRTSSPTQTPNTGGSTPHQVLGLQNWKITLPLPIGSSSSPTEIKQPSLANYVNDPWFIVQNGAVRFRAPVNGATTSGSSYPRSELREMSSNGSSNASWNNSSGVHTMYIDQAITAVPKVKSHVVAGQVHDSDDDVIVIRLEGNQLFVNPASGNDHTLDNNYTLGKRFQVKFEATNGQTRIYYNNSLSPVFTYNRAYSGAYFKAGAYTQANCGNSSPCDVSNYGEVVIYNLQVTHQ